MDKLNGVFFTDDRVRLTGAGLFFGDSRFAGQSGTVTAKDDLADQYRVNLDNGERVWAYASEMEHSEDDDDEDDDSGDAALVPATPETWPKGIDTLNTYEVSLDQSIPDGTFKAKTSEDAVKKACAVRGWDYSEEVYNQAAWNLIDNSEQN